MQTNTLIMTYVHTQTQLLAEMAALKQQVNANTAPRSAVTHAGITCDVCQCPIAGVRYKCLFCKDVDLCSQCENKNMYAAGKSCKPEHAMVKIKNTDRFNASGQELKVSVSTWT